jgi:hypothetical protein
MCHTRVAARSGFLPPPDDCVSQGSCSLHRRLAPDIALSLALHNRTARHFYDAVLMQHGMNPWSRS